MLGRVQAASNGTNKRRQDLWQEEQFLKYYVLWQAYLLMAVRGLGYLALTWSTVVLLGGFVSALGKKDFWCLTAISMIQAARILNDAEDLMFSEFFELPIVILPMPSAYSFVPLLFLSTLLRLVLLPLMIIYVFGFVICAGLSLWRLAQHDYGNIDGDSTRANLMPALDIFYSLVLCQCALFFVHYGNDFRAHPIAASLCRVCKFPEKWATATIEDYLMNTRVKCRLNPASIKGRNLVDYAVDLLGSESSHDYLSGARMLEMFIKQGVDVRSLLLPSRPKIQKLIDTLRWRSSDREIRELAARILAYLAWDIDLAQYPGAIRCISSLLNTTLPYWNNQQESSHQSAQSRLEQPRGEERHTRSHAKNLERHREKKRDNDDPKGDGRSSSLDDTQGNGWDALILQGLTILERLASDQYNCIDICGTPGLLHKIMAPLYSTTLIQDIGISSWADVVNGSLKVVHMLIRSPESTGRRLAHDISSSKQAVSNLESILGQGNKAGKQLQMLAMDILTELTFDSSNNLTPETKENLIKKQMQIFLVDDEGEDDNLRVMAGQTLSALSKTEFMSHTGSGSAFITSKHGYLVDRLTEILDAKNKIVYRAIAAEVLENLSTHHTMDRKHVTNTLLPKVLTEILTNKREPQPESSGYHSMWPNYKKILTGRRKPHRREASQRKLSGPGGHEENHGVSLEGNDEEKQLPEHKCQAKSSNQADAEHTTMMKFHEAFLSLTLVICSKLISADDFDAVARRISPGEGDFVAKLKIIVEENCVATANSLRILKLCGQIAVTMMGRSLYIAHFKDQKFVEALSKASRITDSLESCMLFAGTDGGAKKTARPLLSDLVEEAQAMVAPICTRQSEMFSSSVTYKT